MGGKKSAQIKIYKDKEGDKGGKKIGQRERKSRNKLKNIDCGDTCKLTQNLKRVTLNKNLVGILSPAVG